MRFRNSASALVAVSAGLSALSLPLASPALAAGGTVEVLGTSAACWTQTGTWSTPGPLVKVNVRTLGWGEGVVPQVRATWVLGNGTRINAHGEQSKAISEPSTRLLVEEPRSPESATVEVAWPGLAPASNRFPGWSYNTAEQRYTRNAADPALTPASLELTASLDGQDPGTGAKTSTTVLPQLAADCSAPPTRYDAVVTGGGEPGTLYATPGETYTVDLLSDDKPLYAGENRPVVTLGELPFDEDVQLLTHDGHGTITVRVARAGKFALTYTSAQPSAYPSSAEQIGRLRINAIAPIADDELEVTSAAGATLDPGANDRQPDRTRWSIVSGPEHGTAELTASLLRYTPAPGFSGVDTVTYQAPVVVGSGYSYNPAAPIVRDTRTATVHVLVRPKAADDTVVIRPSGSPVTAYVGIGGNDFGAIDWSRLLVSTPYAENRAAGEARLVEGSTPPTLRWTYAGEPLPVGTRVSIVYEVPDMSGHWTSARATLVVGAPLAASVEAVSATLRHETGLASTGTLALRNGVGETSWRLEASTEARKIASVTLSASGVYTVRGLRPGIATVTFIGCDAADGTCVHIPGTFTVTGAPKLDEGGIPAVNAVAGTPVSVEPRWFTRGATTFTVATPLPATLGTLSVSETGVVSVTAGVAGTGTAAIRACSTLAIEAWCAVYPVTVTVAGWSLELTPTKVSGTTQVTVSADAPTLPGDEAETPETVRARWLTTSGTQVWAGTVPTDGKIWWPGVKMSGTTVVDRPGWTRTSTGLWRPVVDGFNAVKTTAVLEVGSGQAARRATLTVPAAQNAPALALKADAASTRPSTAVRVKVFGNDSGVNLAAATKVTGVSYRHGAVRTTVVTRDSVDGVVLTYTPPSGLKRGATDTITYTVVDPVTQLKATQKVTVSIV